MSLLHFDITDYMVSIMYYYLFSDELIAAIQGDITESSKQLALPEYEHFKNHPFFTGKSEPHCNGAIKNGIIANGISNGHSDVRKLVNGSTENPEHS